MTEAEWLACEGPKPTLEALRGTASDRKLRLYCCACCRRVWSHLSLARQRAVETAERYADGKAGWWETLLGEFLAFPETDWEADPIRAVRTAAFVTVRPWRMRPVMDGAAAASLVARMTSGNCARTHGVTDLVATPSATPSARWHSLQSGARPPR